MRHASRFILSKISAYIFIGMLAFSLTSCQGCKTTVPNSDDTDPSINLVLIDQNGDVQEITSDTREEMPKNADVWVFASAEDADGVKSITLRGSGQRRCGDGEFVTVQHLGYSDSDRAPPTTGPGDTTVEARFASHHALSQSFYRCPSDEKLVGTFVEFEAMTENFHDGQATSPTLTLVSR